MYGGLSINAVQKIQNKTTTIDNFNYGISMSWGVWLLLTNYLGNALSGPHCNPALSFLFFILGAIKFRRCIFYIIAQFIGCYLGALMVFIIYFDGISDFDHGRRQVHGVEGTADIFATYPKDYLSVTGACLDQFFTTAILCVVVIGITDKRNRVPEMAQPAIIGAALWAIISQWSHNCGAALNPARDFSPRLMTLTVGYGWEVFSFNHYKWFWIPMVAPMFGAIVGAYTYKAMLGDYLPTLHPADLEQVARRQTGLGQVAPECLPPSRISSVPNFRNLAQSGPTTLAVPITRWATFNARSMNVGPPEEDVVEEKEKVSSMSSTSTHGI